MKQSAMVNSQMFSSRGRNQRNSLLNGPLGMSGKKKRYETSGTDFVNQMSSRIDKLIGRSIHKKNFKKRFETSAY
jgi:hypothetical protein